MIRYNLWIKIPVPGSHYFIQVGKEFMLPFHPNLTDELTVANYTCTINDIDWMVEDEFGIIRMTATDNLVYHCTKEKAIEHLMEELEDLK
jgi:hypothetical protein